MHLNLFQQYCPNLVTRLIDVIKLALKVPDFNSSKNRIKFECYCRTIALIWFQIDKHLEPLIERGIITNESSVYFICVCMLKCTNLEQKRRRKRFTHDFLLAQLALNKVWKEIEIGK